MGVDPAVLGEGTTETTQNARCRGTDDGYLSVPKRGEQKEKKEKKEKKPQIASPPTSVQSDEMLQDVSLSPSMSSTMVRWTVPSTILY